MDTITLIHCMAINTYRFNSCLIVISCLLISCMYTPVPRNLKKEFYSYTQSQNNDSNNWLLKNVFIIKQIHYLNPIYRDTQIVYSIEGGEKKWHTIIEGDMIIDHVFVFFENGLCINELYHDNIFDLDSVDITKKITRNFNKSYSVGSCGYYSISGDTIKIKTIGRGSYLAGTLIPSEVWYRIKRDDFHLIYFGNLEAIPQFNSSKIGRFDSIISISSKRYALKGEIINPDSCWIMKEVWFWKYKNEFMKWKKLTLNK